MEGAAVEHGERLNPVDLYWIFGELARSKLEIPKDDPFWNGFDALEDEFEELFRDSFSSGDGWSACFNSADGLASLHWWREFQRTDRYSRAQAVVEQMKQMLLAHGLNPSHLDNKALLKLSYELDEPICGILVPDATTEVLRRSFGWMEVRLISLTMPPENEEEPPIM